MHLKHRVTINVTKPDDEKRPVLISSRQTMRSRLFELLFGKNVGLLVVAPGDSVETVEIKEIEAGGEIR